MVTLTVNTKLSSALADVTSVTLSNAAGTVGVKRNDTSATVVSAGTALVHASTGEYSYEFAAPAEHVFYTAHVKVVMPSSTVYREVVFYVGSTGATLLVPSEVLSEYCVTALGLFSEPSAGAAWPLYRSSLPDGKNVRDDVVAIYDTSGYLQAKRMDSVLQQRYGIQFTLRSTDYDAGYRKLADALDALKGVKNVNVTVGTKTWRVLNVSQMTTVGVLGVEKSSKQRYLFTANLLLSVVEA